jgi:hypothetical protein
MYIRMVLAMFSIALVSSFAHAQHDHILCTQCVMKAKAELNRCLEAAISREDKESCTEKNESQTQSCSDGVCKIEKAVQGGNTTERHQERKAPPIP